MFKSFSFFTIILQTIHLLLLTFLIVLLLYLLPSFSVLLNPVTQLFPLFLGEDSSKSIILLFLKTLEIPYFVSEYSSILNIIFRYVHSDLLVCYRFLFFILFLILLVYSINNIFITVHFIKIKYFSEFIFLYVMVICFIFIFFSRDNYKKSPIFW